MGLHFSSAIEIARLVRERRVSAIDVLEHFLARVAKYDPRLNAIIWLDAERARERAKEADAALAKGQVWGPLHGVPMTIKESYNVAGSPTTWGDPKLRDNVTETSALAVERLKKAGVVLFGKTNVPLMLADHQSYNDIYGTTNNPWDVSRTPGGSSGGSAAALAAGLTGIDTPAATIHWLGRSRARSACGRRRLRPRCDPECGRHHDRPTRPNPTTSRSTATAATVRSPRRC
jgi:amidase